MPFRDDLEATRRRAEQAECDRADAEAELEAARAKARKAEARAAALEKRLARASAPRAPDPRLAEPPRPSRMYSNRDPLERMVANAVVDAIDSIEPKRAASGLQVAVVIAALLLVAAAAYFVIAVK